MIDLKLLRTKGEFLKEFLLKKKFECDIDAIIKLDQEKIVLLKKIEKELCKKNILEKQIQLQKSIKEENKISIDELIEESKNINNYIKKLKEEIYLINKDYSTLILSIPNIPDKSVPIGDNDVVIKCNNSFKNENNLSIPHYEIPWINKFLDFKRGNKVTGSGFPFYIGPMAKLLRSLINFFIEEASLLGYEEVMSPIFANHQSCINTGQLPDKENQMYKIENYPFYVIPTSEVTITNLYSEEILNESNLPLKKCCYTPCFRKEAGSWGKISRGLNRLHQFDKVELVKFVHPSDSMKELDLLIKDVEFILNKLELNYRLLLVSSKNIGFAHSKQYDFEVWSNGQKNWLEVSSCSNFTDFQSRRAKIRYKDKINSKLNFVHTLNGSCLGIPRILAAILENNLEKNGLVRIPKVLRKWFDSDVIGEQK